MPPGIDVEFAAKLVSCARNLKRQSWSYFNLCTFESGHDY
jgi:hypothetical protein